MRAPLSPATGGGGLRAGAVWGLAAKMAAVGWLRCLVLLHFAASLCSALYFHIGETEKKCFIEEIPDETMVIGKGNGMWLLELPGMIRIDTYTLPPRSFKWRGSGPGD